MLGSVVLALLAAGCAAPPPAPRLAGVVVEAVVRVTAGAVVVDARARNDGPAAVVVVDHEVSDDDRRVPRPGASVLPREGGVEIAHRVLPLPADTDFATPPLVGATTVAPGAEHRWRVVADRPLRARALLGEAELLEPAATVVYCTGLLPAPPDAPPSPVLAHGTATDGQDVRCSTPVPLAG